MDLQLHTGNTKMVTILLYLGSNLAFIITTSALSVLISLLSTALLFLRDYDKIQRSTAAIAKLVIKVVTFIKAKGTKGNGTGNDPTSQN
jgi:hypothetical protein